MVKCKRCGRPLKTPVSIKYEMGPTCLEKVLGIKPRSGKTPSKYPKLFDLEIKARRRTRYAEKGNH